MVAVAGRPGRVQRATGAEQSCGGAVDLIVAERAGLADVLAWRCAGRVVLEQPDELAAVVAVLGIDVGVLRRAALANPDAAVGGLEPVGAGRAQQPESAGVLRLSRSGMCQRELWLRQQRDSRRQRPSRVPSRAEICEARLPSPGLTALVLN